MPTTPPESSSQPSSSSEKPINVRDPKVVDCIDRYWRSNIRVMGVLLLIWAAVGLGAGILFADTLNQFHLGGFGLGFWFAQQGSIFVFVVLILIYCIQMNRLDVKHHRELKQIRNSSTTSSSSDCS